MSSITLDTLLALKNLDPGFLKTFILSILSSSSSFSLPTSTSSPSSSSSSTSSSDYSTYWSAIISLPSIVQSCVSTKSIRENVQEKTFHYSVPHAEKYLIAYKSDFVFLGRLTDLLKIIDPSFFNSLNDIDNNNENGNVNNNINNNTKKTNNNDKKLHKHLSKDLREAAIDQKWSRELKVWSNL